MIQANAIYAGGVFRPLEPLELPENEMVALTISTAGERGYSKDEAAQQREVLLAYVAKVESLPDNAPQDDLSNRDHDLLIYGK
jgi:predicted DNA-binding antitoxin AbrB/MazE fold protein